MRVLIACALAAAGPSARGHDGAVLGSGAGPIEPWLAALLALAVIAYLHGVSALWRGRPSARGIGRRHVLAFAAGWLVVVAALAPPFDAFAARQFSLHMVQHELLMVLAAPLLVLGRPFMAWSWAMPRTAQAVHRAFARPLPAAAWRSATSPLGAWLLQAAALWLWHAPPLFEAALARPLLHELQHATFFATALLFWWSITGPRPAARAGGIALFALFTTMLHTGVLGALLALSPRVWYPTYLETALALGGDPLRDQQLGGLLMWVPGSVVYLAAALWAVAQLLSAPPPQEARP